MQKFLKWIETRLMPPMTKIGMQRHMVAIRNGVISTGFRQFSDSGCGGMVSTTYSQLNNSFSNYNGFNGNLCLFCHGGFFG